MYVLRLVSLLSLLLLSRPAWATELTAAAGPMSVPAPGPGMAVAAPPPPGIPAPKLIPEAEAKLAAFRQVVANTAGMVANPAAIALAKRHGLDVVNVTWEDTGRFQGSAVGPNISDMTIQVQVPDGRGGYQLTCMPVIRFHNFTDKTGDIAPEKFFVLVGNQKGEPLRRVSLRELLGNLRLYLSSPTSWVGNGTSLLADRDTHVLVSAQACFLPVPKEDKAEFTPVLFNYQSRPGDPAVLTILATREGTSVTVIDNQRDTFFAGAALGQRLFFNKNGQRAVFTGQRLSDFRAGEAAPGGPAVSAAGEKALNMVLLIQVPLKQRGPSIRTLAPGVAELVPKAEGVRNTARANARRLSDVEAAVIGHGQVEGTFAELAGLAVERDDRFPVRVTVQFYKATSNGVVNEADIAEIASEIAKVYAKADYVGSLVTDGTTDRPTEHDGPKVQPPNWWADFWARYQVDYGRTREDVCRELRELRGADWHPRTEGELADEAKKLPPVKVKPMSLGGRAMLGVSTAELVVLGGGALMALGIFAYIVGRRHAPSPADGPYEHTKGWD